jgi:hypothetical protein
MSKEQIKEALAIASGYLDLAAIQMDNDRPWRAAEEFERAMEQLDGVLEAIDRLSHE